MNETRTPTTTPRSPAGSRRVPRQLLVPALCFVLGALVGAAALATTTLSAPEEQQLSVPRATTPTAAAPGGSSPAAGPSEAPGAGPPQEASAGAADACALAEERALALVDLGEEAAAALAAVDARRLQEVVDRMQDLEPLVRESATACRAQARLPDEGR